VRSAATSSGDSTIVKSAPSIQIGRAFPDGPSLARTRTCPRRSSSLQLAWIAEKVHEWTDLPVDRDQLLTTVSLYWYTCSGATAAHTLYEQAHSSDWGPPPAVPQGFAVFGADETVRKLVLAPPGAHWTDFPRGRPFPAMEAPAQLAAALRAFFGPLR
jgi:epoxide hydrolase